MAQKTEKLKWKFTGGATVRGLEGDLSLVAGEDLSAKQYYFVTPGSVVGEVKLSTGGSLPTPFGVLQNTPTTGQAAIVRVFGITQLVPGPNASQLTYGVFINSASTGRAQYSGASGIILGRWMSAACSGSSGTNLVTNLATGSAFINCAAFTSGSTNASA